MATPRQLALVALQAIAAGTFADVALDRILQHGSAGKSPTATAPLTPLDRRLITELVYGTVRRQRTLDALIDQLASKPAAQQPPVLRLILHLGLYQLRYLNQIPAAAAVDTTVELVKANRLGGLAGFVNGLLRRYVRLAETGGDPLSLPADPVQRLGVLHSYPDWIVQIWLDQVGEAETAQLCDWLNQPPPIDLRVNRLRAPLPMAMAEVTAALQARGLTVQPVPYAPQALRLNSDRTPMGAATTDLTDLADDHKLDDHKLTVGSDRPNSPITSRAMGPIWELPGFTEGWWMVQDSSAQMVSHLLDPQPGEVVIDACAAPGGKTTHMAELMQNQGVVWGCDRYASRLKKLTENARRLGMTCIQQQVGDSRQFPTFVNQADRVLVDAPCSGLGTLHRHADARWRQTPTTAQELTTLQLELLQQAATWVKPGGCLVYATCTLNPAENQQVVQAFLRSQTATVVEDLGGAIEGRSWMIEPPPSPWTELAAPEGWVTIWPHRQQMDGFFMVRLRCQG